MKNQVLVKRYTEGLAGALKTEEEYRTVGRELGEFSALLEENEELRLVLLRPFLSAGKKARIVQDLLARERYQDKSARLIVLLLRHRRLDLLPGIVRDLPELWRERQGIVTFEVRSVVPVGDGQRARLEETLGKIENGPVACTYVLDPAIVGGLTIKKGNMVYDVSLKGQLERLREKIRER